MKFKDPHAKPPQEPEPAPEPRDDLGIEAERRAGSDDRCALCHDAILLAHAGARCTACATVLHHECAKGVATCPTLGCGVKTRSYVPLVEHRGLVERLQSEWSLGRGLLAGLLLVALLVTGAVWNAVGNADRDAMEAIRARRQAELSALEKAKRNAWIETLRSSSDEARQRAAATALEAYPSAAAFLAEACLNGVPSVRKAAAWSLAKNPGKLQGARVLCLALTRGNAERRLAAAQALAESRLASAAARAALESATADSDARIRAAAAQALWNLDGELAAPHLIRLLEDSNSEVADLSQTLLSERAPLLSLVEALDAPGVRTRRGAANALARRRSIPPHVLRPLMKRLTDTDAQTQLAAATALHLLGPQAAPAVPALERLLDARWTKIRLATCKTLGAIGPAAKAACPRLEALLDGDPDSLVQEAARDALQAIGRLR